MDVSNRVEEMIGNLPLSLFIGQNCTERQQIKVMGCVILYMLLVCIFYVCVLYGFERFQLNS